MFARLSKGFSLWCLCHGTHSISYERLEKKEKMDVSSWLCFSGIYHKFNISPILEV